MENISLIKTYSPYLFEDAISATLNAIKALKINKLFIFLN